MSEKIKAKASRYANKFFKGSDEVDSNIAAHNGFYDGYAQAIADYKERIIRILDEKISQFEKSSTEKNNSDDKLATMNRALGLYIAKEIVNGGSDEQVTK